MARSTRKTAFVETFAKAADRRAHPHLAPINTASFAAERSVVLAKAPNLLAYQRYLADARAVKARRKGASASFERNVLAQARQARDDLDAFTGSGLRMIQQVNHAGLWERMLPRATRALSNSGPVTPRAMWAELVQNQQNRQHLAAHGVTAEIAASITEALGKLDATAVLRNGKVAVETRVAGERDPRRMVLRTAASRPTGIVDLLRRSQFDRVVTALSGGLPVHLQAVPAIGATSHEPADLFAFAAVASRQRMTEHVRKLEDTGLAVYQGNDPITFIAALLVIDIFLGLIGSIILELCDVPPDAGVQQPDWVCTAGAVMVWIALAVLGAVALIFFFEGVAIAFVGFVAFSLLVPQVVEHFDQLFPQFDPSGEPV